MLELGCGLGLVASAGARAGFAVTATDYYADALGFAAVNVWRNAEREVETRHVDWRAFPDDLGRFALVVASDVLYEHEYATLVARAIDRALEPGGRGLVADPGRVAAPAFLEECATLGLRAARSGRHPWSAGAINQTIDLYEVVRAG
jgi:predicted nicotinamide N-methyase